MSRLTAVAVATIAATFFATTLAEAQSRRYQKRTVYQGRTVYVTPRSFLDPGNVVPIGTGGANYVYIGQYNNPPPYYNQLRQQETFVQPNDPRFPTTWPVYGPFGASGYYSH
jgi:hypothetical protein